MFSHMAVVFRCCSAEYNGPSICSGRSRWSSASRSNLVREDAKLQKIISEKKVEQLKRAKARKLKEEQFKLELKLDI